MEEVLQLVDAAELAARLAVKVPTIRAWTRLTDLPRVRVGRLVRFEPAKVRAWLDLGGPAGRAKPAGMAAPRAVTSPKRRRP